MNRQTFSALGLGLALWTSAYAGRACAKELDQFTDRLRVIAYYASGYREIAGAPGPSQVDDILDQRMNALLDQLELSLQTDIPQSDAERDAQVRAAFQHPLLPKLVTPYEEWVKHEAPVPLYRVRDKGIYGHAVDYSDMRISWYIELSPIIQVAHVLMGIDKLGHFLAQGFQYYERLHALPPGLSPQAREDAIRLEGHRGEEASLGIATTGVYSFADLAANWDGMLFFSALFEDVQADGHSHPRYFARAANGGYHRVRDFHWAEWVTADWDEVLNPAAIQSAAFYRKVVDNFWRRAGGTAGERPSICQHYQADPARYLGVAAALRARTRYAEPRAASRAAPYALDVRKICHHEDGRVR